MDTITVNIADNKVCKKNKVIKSKALKTPIDIDMLIPKINEYATFKTKKYTLADLRMVCKHYKQKSSGTKEHLLEVMYIFLHGSYNAQIIQRAWKKYCVKVYNNLHGPARKNRKLCVNETDFFTMDPISEISDAQFFSFKDTDEMIYGFDLLSLHNLILKSGKTTTNPYNRNIIKPNIKNDIKKIIKFGKFINQKLDIDIEDVNVNLDPKKIMELRIKSLFQEIDSLGNYTNSEWFSSLDRIGIIRFIRELYDIWEYRAHLSPTIKMEICPPTGNPFFGLNMMELPLLAIEVLQMISVNFMENIIKSGINRESKCLGCNYVLCAITLVNPEAAQALPWLYYSVSHND
jgi:hypothetical protein